jgi:hypothetical protein
VPAIQPQLLTPLKKLLKERFVPHLPPLLGNGAAADKDEKQVARAFSAFFLQKRFDLDIKTASQSVIDDYNDHGIDAIYYHEPEKILYLVQSKLKASDQFQLSEAQSFISGLELLLNKDFERFNQNVQNMLPAIEEALDECNSIQLVIAYVSSGITIQAQNELKQKLSALIDNGEAQLQEKYQEFGPDLVEQAMRDEQAVITVNEKIGVYKCSTMQGSRKAVFGLAKLNDLIALHEKHGRSLYEKNIRYFIGGGRRGVSAAIKDTLLNEPQNFFYLNNGITLIGNHVETKSVIKGHNGSRNVSVQGLSVVNGAQTIASAAQFLEQYPEADISQAKVMVTVINTGNDDFHKRVTKARNLQNPVDLSNFAALDDNQERLRQEMALFGVEYQYRPHRQSAGGIPTIAIENLAKALACLHGDIRFGARLKSEPAQFTTEGHESYTCLFSDTLNGVKAINAMAAFDVIQHLVTQAERSAPSPEKRVYRHCGYSLATLLMAHLRSKINGADMLSVKDFEGLVSVPFDELRQLLADRYLAVAQGAAPHAFFKRIPETAKLMLGIWLEYQQCQEDPAVLAKQNAHAANDPYNQALFYYLASKAVQL